MHLGRRLSAPDPDRVQARVFLVLLACASRPSATGQALNAVAGAAAAPVALATVTPLDESGLRVLLANDEGSMRVVNFWATWCEPCVDELAALATVAHVRTDVSFVLVSVDLPEDATRVRAFAAARALSLPLFHLRADDAPTVLARVVADWPDVIPVTVVIEPGGAVRARFDGALDAPALTDALR